jgi:predicted DNA-binding transcriptional regulator YafY
MGSEAIARWCRAPRRPVAESDDPQVRSLAVAVRSNQRIRFRYLGGSTPGAAREVSPGFLFTAEGFAGVYFSGYCHTRRAERTFLVARMTRPADSLPLANALTASVS